MFLEEDTIADLFSRESTIVSSALYTAASEGVCAPSGTEEGNGRCPSSVWTRPGAVKQGQPGGPVGTAEQGTGRGRREVRRGATRARGDVEPKGTATCGGKRFRERIRGNVGTPGGAASFRQPCPAGVAPKPPSTPPSVCCVDAAGGLCPRRCGERCDVEAVLGFVVQGGGRCGARAIAEWP